MPSIVRQWLALGLALFLLNSALSFHNVWPTFWIEVRPELSVEAAALVLLLAFSHWIGVRPSRRAAVALAIILFVMVIGRYMEVTAPALYGRAINLYWDAQYVPDVAAMFAANASAFEILAVIGGIVAIIVVTTGLLYWSLRRVQIGLEAPGTARVLKGAGAFLVVAYFLGYYTSVPTLRWFSIPVTHTYTRQAGFVLDALGGSEALAALPATQPLASIDADALPREDVIVTFIESYGAVAYDADDVAAALAAPRGTLEARIAGSGRQVVSAFLDAPTFGGGSWLSHISFMTGFDISEAAAYDALLTQSRQTLPRIFGVAGFRTVALMPGLRNDWPEGSFYGFDAIYGSERLDYAGPEFGWWRIPDQFALARLEALELGLPARAPLFVFFPTISTHSPFYPTPPYQPDWSALTSAAPYAVADLGDSLTRSFEWTELRRPYADALAYTYDYWGGYLASHGNSDLILVLVGDHQPPATVSGEGARWHVPVHVVTRDNDLIAQLLAAGFVPGLMPAMEPVAAMHELGLLLFGRAIAP